MGGSTAAIGGYSAPLHVSVRLHDKAIHHAWAVPWLVLVEWACAAALAGFASVCILNTYVGHLTPDNSIYLLHARTFVNEWNRFTASHDSKGFMLTLVLAPFVRLLGATMAAGATAQCITYLLACLCIYSIARTYASKAGALLIASTALCLVHSHYIWGGNMRPEDFALGYVAVALYTALRTSPGWRFAGGVMVSLCFFTKTSLVLAPGALLASAVVLDAARTLPQSRQQGLLLPLRVFVRQGFWPGLGFGLTSLAILTWIVLFDDVSGWYRQTIEWPAEYRGTALTAEGLRRMATLLRWGRLDYLLLACIPGLVAGWAFGRRRLSILLGVLLSVEFFRTAFEGGKWPYTLTVSIMALVLGTSLLGLLFCKPKALRLVGILIPLYCMGPALGGTALAEANAVRYRLVEGLPEPFEHLAAEMRKAGYTDGESVFEASNGCQIILLLNAPPPAPVLSHHFQYVSEAEKSAARSQYAQDPPEWVVTVNDRLVERISTDAAASRFIMGSQNYAYSVMVPDEQALPEPLREADEGRRKGDFLSPMLPASAQYVNVARCLCLDAWRLVKDSQPCPPQQCGIPPEDAKPTSGFQADTLMAQNRPHDD